VLPTLMGVPDGCCANAAPAKLATTIAPIMARRTMFMLPPWLSATVTPTAHRSLVILDEVVRTGGPHT
jgi:hypothetical protein